MAKSDKKVNYEKRVKIAFISFVAIVTSVILVGIGLYVHYMRTTTYIWELLNVGPSGGDQVIEDTDGRLAYVLSSSGEPAESYFKFSAQFACFEGEKGKMWTSTNSKEHSEKALELYRSLVKVRGKEVTDWSKDKITYPIYSVKFTLREASVSKSFCGVWSNGYLITSVGKVYKCKCNFSGFEKAGDTVFPYSEVDLDGDHWMLWPLTQFD